MVRELQNRAAIRKMKMTCLLKVVILMVSMVDVALTAINDPDAHSKLLTDLLRDYHKEVHPAYDGPVKVKFGFKLVYFDFIDEAKELATVHGWLRIGWQDLRLSWDRKAYGNLSEITMDLSNIWVPDIELFNSARITTGHHTNQASLSNSGYLIWYPSYQIDFICRMDLQFFPYDEQKCQLKYGSWHYDASRLELNNRSSNVDTGNHIRSRDFILTGTSLTKHNITYPCCDESYIDVTFTIRLKRSSNAYGIKLVLPAVLSGFLVLATFLIPPASHEKITLCGMLFLCLLLLLIYLHLIIPTAGDTILGEYLVFALFIDFFATVIAVVSYNLDTRLSPMPTRSQLVMDTECDDNDLKLQMPKDRKKEWLRHLDKVCFVLFSVVFIVGLAIILGRRA